MFLSRAWSSFGARWEPRRNFGKTRADIEPRFSKKFPKIKGVIFDMDGTLVDSEINTGLAVDRLLKEHGIDTTCLDDTLCYGKTWTLCVDELFKLYPRFKIAMESNAGGHAEAMTKLQHYFHHGPTPPPIKKAVWAVTQAHDIVGKSAIATSSNRESLEHTIDLLGIRSKLSVAIAAEDYQKSKPDPDPYLTAAKLLGEEPSNCLVFEDSIAGITAAKAAGMSVVAILQRSPNEQLARELADAAITNYEDLGDDFFESVSALN